MIKNYWALILSFFSDLKVLGFDGQGRQLAARKGVGMQTTFPTFDLSPLRSKEGRDRVRPGKECMGLRRQASWKGAIWHYWHVLGLNIEHTELDVVVGQAPPPLNCESKHLQKLDYLATCFHYKQHGHFQLKQCRKKKSTWSGWDSAAARVTAGTASGPCVPRTAVSPLLPLP